MEFSDTRSAQTLEVLTHDTKCNATRGGPSRAISTILVCGLLAGCAQLAASASPTRAQWQAMAKSDLVATRDVIARAHPGMLDAQNPSFLDWERNGYDQALALSSQVASYDSALAMVRYYVTGFRDGHLGYSDEIRGSNEPMLTPGWRVARRGAHIVVVGAMHDWPSALPPIGAVLLDCDGKTPEELIRENVAPFHDRRDLPGVRDSLLLFLSLPALPSVELRECGFRDAYGRLVRIAQHYHDVSATEWFTMAGGSSRSVQRTAHQNRASLEGGTLWIHAGNFSPQADDIAALDRMIEFLHTATGVQRIVFDVRGNRGGDSSLGDRIFDAATGGLVFDQKDLDRLPRVYAQWRVSDFAIDTQRRRLAEFRKLYDADSAEVKWTQQLLAELESARTSGKVWVEQPGGARLDRSEIAHRGGRLRLRDVPVLVLTDNRCVSACLDFGDRVLQVPGSIQVGQTTSADTAYIDVGVAVLPSGNKLIVPLKVWRNRLRGNNQPLIPDVPIDLDALDEPAIHAAVLAAFDQ
jgi:hypothetical protein